MRTNQIGTHLELIDENEKISFTVYGDSNELTYAMSRVLKKIYRRLLKINKLNISYDEWIDSFKIPVPDDDLGKCEIYES